MARSWSSLPPEAIWKRSWKWRGAWRTDTVSTCHPFACLHPDSATESEFSPEEILAEIATGVRGKAMGTFHEPVRFRSATHEAHPVRRHRQGAAGILPAMLSADWTAGK